MIPGNTSPEKIPLFEWDSKTGMLSEGAWRPYVEVDEWRERNPGDYLAFERDGYHRKGGVLDYLSMPITTEDLKSRTSKDELRPLIFTPGEDKMRRHEKPGLIFIL